MKNELLILAQEQFSIEKIKPIYNIRKIKLLIYDDFYDVNIQTISGTVVISVIEIVTTELEIGSIAYNNFEIKQEEILTERLRKKLERFLI